MVEIWAGLFILVTSVGSLENFTLTVLTSITPNRDNTRKDSMVHV